MAMDEPQQDERLTWEELDRTDGAVSAQAVSADVARLVLELWQGHLQAPPTEERVIAF